MTTEAPPNYTISVEIPVDDNGQQELSGWRTVVKDGSHVAYDSQISYGRAGIFPSDKTATRHGERWVAAKLELAATVARVKREREAELPRLLEQSLEREVELKAEKTDISGQIKAQSKLRARLARKKSARAVVVQLCEERLGELLEAGAS